MRGWAAKQLSSRMSLTKMDEMAAQRHHPPVGALAALKQGERRTHSFSFSFTFLYLINHLLHMPQMLYVSQGGSKVPLWCC